MKRVLVIGSGGAGKTTFAKRLGPLLGLEVIHLDAHYWRPGWVETPKDVWAKTVAEFACRDSWLMDGNYSGTLDIRFDACDTVIFLDLPRTVCLWRVFKRVFENRRAGGGSRPDMPEGCPEKVSLAFALWVWNYPKRARPRVLEKLKASSGKKKLIRLSSRAEVEAFLADAKKRGARDL